MSSTTDDLRKAFSEMTKISASESSDDYEDNINENQISPEDEQAFRENDYLRDVMEKRKQGMVGKDSDDIKEDYERHMEMFPNCDEDCYFCLGTPHMPEPVELEDDTDFMNTFGDSVDISEFGGFGGITINIKRVDELHITRR